MQSQCYQTIIALSKLNRKKYVGPMPTYYAATHIAVHIQQLVILNFNY